MTLNRFEGSFEKTKDAASFASLIEARFEGGKHLVMEFSAEQAPVARQAAVRAA